METTACKGKLYSMCELRVPNQGKELERRLNAEQEEKEKLRAQCEMVQEQLERLEGHSHLFASDSAFLLYSSTFNWVL